MKAHLVQMDIAWENPNANFEKVDRLVRSTVIERGDLILLPEMFDSGFSFSVSKNADNGATISYLRDLSRRTGAVIHGHRTLVIEGSARNRASIVEPGGAMLAEYDKMHLFSYIGETEHLTGGEKLAQYQWNGLKVCPAICYDLRFPELFRGGVKQGAEMFAIGACWPAARAMHRRTLALARAIENQAFVLVCNRCGSDPPPTQAKYDGHSMIVDPQGAILAEGDEGECVVTAEVDAAAVSNWREKFPALGDIKPAALFDS